MAYDGRAWAIVLAGGAGTRLHAWTLDQHGRHVPKQFWGLGGHPPLVRLALSRAARVVPRERILSVVTHEHREWWSHLLGDQPRENVIVQATGQGTAVGALLPLISILTRDLDPVVLLMPSDHHVEREDLFAKTMEQAVHVAAARPSAAVLIGVRPEWPDPDYGWIVPGAWEPDADSLPLESWTERPEPDTARVLMERGGMLSSFVIAARAGTLLELIEQAHPALVQECLRCVLSTRRAPEEPLVAGRELAPLDLVHDVLLGVTGRIRVLVAPACGWIDLGTPQRVSRWLERNAPAVGAAQNPEAWRTPFARTAHSASWSSSASTGRTA